jgi:hypothetical protein
VQSALKAGFAYFTIVFAVGFLLGALRVLALVPRLGEALAVAIELPLMLAVSWLVCKSLITRFSVPRGLVPRIAMGGLAFGLLMVAEISVSVLGFRRTISEHLANYQTAAAAMGLLGQLAFALFPAIQSWTWADDPERE